MIVVNGETSAIAPGTTVTQLMRELDAPERGVAVALDGEVVRRGHQLVEATPGIPLQLIDPGADLAEPPG